MENFSYFELIAFYYRGIFDQMYQGVEFKKAEAISFDSFWDHSDSPDILQNLIMLIESMNVDLSLEKQFRKQSVELFLELYDQIGKIDLMQYLTASELEVFNESIEILSANLKTYPINR